jgi:hypothetical protein
MRKMFSVFSSDHLIANEFCYLPNHRVDQDGLMKRKEVRFHFPKQDLLIFLFNRTSYYYFEIL